MLNEIKNKEFQEKRKKDLSENKIPYENRMENKDPIEPVYLECTGCKSKNLNIHKYGVPTSLGMRNNDYKSYFIDDNYQQFKKVIEPTEWDEYIPFNKDCWKKSYHPNFDKVDARNTKSYANLYDKNASHHENYNNGVLGYKSTKNVYSSKEFDGRLVSVPHGGEILALDHPPLYESMPVNDSIYTDSKMELYRTKVYQDYTDIKAGNRLYYIPDTHSDAYYLPNYTIPMNMEGVLYKDPMGAIIPYYIRTPLITYDVLDTKKNNYGELTWIRDTQENREDMMSLRTRYINKKRYNPRYTGQGLMD